MHSHLHTLQFFTFDEPRKIIAKALTLEALRGWGGGGGSNWPPPLLEFFGFKILLLNRLLKALAQLFLVCEHIFWHQLSDVIGNDIIAKSHAICVLTAKSQFFARNLLNTYNFTICSTYITWISTAKCCFPVNLRYKSENLNKIWKFKNSRWRPPVTLFIWLLLPSM